MKSTELPTNRVLMSAISVALAMAASAGPAHGQDTAAQAMPAKGGAGQLEEVVVTAQRRTEDIIDVPYNISAVSGEYIEDLRIVDQAELMRTVPGASVVDRGYRNAGVINGITIRGLNTNRTDQGDMALSAVPSVSTYVNDTPIYANFVLKDLERVEVLRGPQGTLYGSGSLGGTVRYITRKPKLESFDGSVEGSLSQTDGSDGTNWSVDGMLNLPIGKTAAVRMAFGHIDNAGVIDYANVYRLDGNGAPVAPNGLLDPAASYRNVRDADTAEIDYGRVELLWRPTDTFSAMLTYAIQSDDIGGRRAPTRGEDGYGNKYGEYENGSIQLEPASRDVDLTSLEMDLDLGFATLTSSTSYYDHSGESLSDNTGYYANQRFGGWLQYYDNYPRPMAQADRRYGDQAFVQELRLVSNADTDRKFDYVVGIFYQSQDMKASQESYLRGFKQYEAAKYPPPEFVISDQDFNYHRTQEFEETALFGELTYHFTDRLSVTGGMRYYENDNTTDIRNFFSGACDLSGANADASICWYPRDYSPDFKVSQDDSGQLFKGNIAYQLSDQQTLYGTISEGYRRGGANIVPLTGTFAENEAWLTYEPDTNTNYEVGFKGATNTLRYSIAAFYVDWQDIQIDTVSTVWGFYVAQNGDTASSRGIELELDGVIGDAWRYHFGYAYTDAHLDDPVLRPFPTLTGDYPVVAKSGTTLPGTPENAANASLDYTMPLGGFQWTNRVNVYYQSETENSILTDNGTPTSAFNASRYQHTWDGFSIWGLSSTLDAERWSATLYVKNLANEEGVSGGFLETAWGTSPANGFYGNDAKVLISQPRTIGLAATYKF